MRWGGAGNWDGASDAVGDRRGDDGDSALRALGEAVKGIAADATNVPLELLDAVVP
jgi:hypothetical protein